MNNINMNKLLALFTVFATFLGTSYGKTIYVNANYGKLPAGYTECEYLGSTGTQYIDTGYAPNDATEVICVWRGSVIGRLYGIFDATKGFTAILGSNGGGAGWIYGAQIANLYFNWSTTYTTRQNSDGVYVNGVLEAEYAAADFTSPGSMYLFAQAGRTPLFTGRIFECSISDDGTLVRDFVPALDSDGTPCLYDLVTATPYYNAGTGDFLYSVKAFDGTSWSSPYTNLQDAVTASDAGDLVLVTNGVYSPISTGNKAITIQSVNGYADTIIDGGGVSRCATLGTDVVLRGFLLKNGYVSGDGGGCYGGSLYNSIISNNLATGNGGGVWGAVVYDSLIVNNTAARVGGGSYGGTLTGCTISGNIALIDGGGIYKSTAYDSLIVSNAAKRYGGALTRGKYYNCTIYGNTAPDWAAGYAGGDATYPTLYNCVVYGNVNTGANAWQLQIPASGVFAFSSIDGANRFLGTLTPAQFVQSIYGDPLFTDPLNSDFTLLPTSPCINKGANQYVTTSTDLAGRPRIKDWRVDMGAYENQSQRLAVTPNPLYPMGRTQIDVTLDDYVQDGLIQHFDGHVLDPAVKIWPQLVEGQPNHFAPYYDNASMYNAYTLVPGVGMVFDTNGTYRSRPRFFTDSFAFFGSNGPPGTVEMCVTQKSNPPNTRAAMSGQSGGRGLTMMRIHSTNPIWGIYAAVYPWFGGPQTGSNPSAYETNMLITTSAIMDKGLLDSVFVNGVQKTVSHGSVLSGAYPRWQVLIGGDNGFTSGGFVGTVHAIRIYDRKLEPWEVEKNRKLDERRF